MIETGKRKQPSGETLIRLAGVLGTTTEYLLTGGGEQPSEKSVLAAVGGAAPRKPFRGGNRVARA